MNEKVLKALNDQVNMEIYSAYLYYAMAGYFMSINLTGFANWLHAQTMEELFHAFKFYAFINEKRARSLMQPVEGPPNEWPSPIAAFEDALAHEMKVTASINSIMELAVKEKEHATVNFLQWFISEQVEEEANVDGVLQNLKMAAGAGPAMMMLDREMSVRKFNVPLEMQPFMAAAAV